MIVVAVVTALGAPACGSHPSPAPPTSQPSAPSRPGSAPAVIVDTDFSRYWDDASVIGLANVLYQQGRVEVLGIMSDVHNEIAVAALDAVDTAYGHPDIPLGALASSDADTEPHGYTDELVSTLPHSVEGADDVPDAVTLYRRLLADEPDGSVTIVSLGSYTNLAGLLASPADRISPLDGRALIARKVDRLVIMDGVFPDGLGPLTNQQYDLPAAAAVVGQGTAGTGWPTPLAWVDGTTGIFANTAAQLCTTAPPEHPLRIAHTNLFGCGPSADGNWDAPTFLYAIGDSPGTFAEAGQGGSAVINHLGGLSWQPTSSRPDDLYVHLADQTALTARVDTLLPLGIPPE